MVSHCPSVPPDAGPSCYLKREPPRPRVIFLQKEETAQVFMMKTRTGKNNEKCTGNNNGKKKKKSKRRSSKSRSDGTAEDVGGDGGRFSSSLERRCESVFEKLPKMVAKLIDCGIVNENSWVMEDFESYLDVHSDPVKRMRARKAISIARRYLGTRESPLRYLLRGNGTGAPRDISDNLVYRMIRLHNLNPRVVAAVMWAFLRSRTAPKNCLWLCGDADTGALDLANSLVACVPLTGVLVGRPSQEDLAACVDKMMIWWRDPPEDLLQSDTYWSLLTGTLLKIRVREVTKSLKKTPVLVTTERAFVRTEDQNPKSIYLMSKMWKVCLAGTVPTNMLGLRPRDMREYIQWLEMIEMSESVNMNLYHSFEIDENTRGFNLL